MEDDDSQQVRSELPYEAWTEDALRLVAIRALEHASREGLPGEHHFYVTFRTDQPGVDIPARLRAKYPQEMTIVLQHQFWDLKVDKPAERFSVGLSFGGVSSILVVPFAALSGFADPHVRFGLRFTVAGPADAPHEQTPDDAADEKAAQDKAGTIALVPELAPRPASAPASEPAGEPATGDAEIVSLDKFRRRKD